MGYTTEFTGEFEFNKEVPMYVKDYINRFCRTRHMRRNVDELKQMYPDWKDRCWLGFLGLEGEYFLDEDYDYQENPSVLDINRPPQTQPGLWCQWIITEDRKHLAWDGGEKFYEYIEWLQYMIDNFFTPSGFFLNGSVEWQGEDPGDTGTIVLKNNNMHIEYL